MELAPEGGQPMVDKGKYVVVMKRQSDGLWKVAIDIWNSDLQEPMQK
jgi:ketosteroid isomerase-like protein